MSEIFLDALRATFAERKNQPALVHQGQSLAYGEIDERAGAIAAWFQERGLREGDRIALCTPHKPAFLLAHLGAVLLAYHLKRHLARSKALEPGRAADPAQALVDRLLHSFARNAHFHPALQGAGRFNRNLHAHGVLVEGRPGRGGPEKPRILPRPSRGRASAAMARKEGLEPSRGLPTGT